MTAINEPAKDTANITTNADNDRPKSDGEVALEAFQTSVELTKDLIENKRVNDSIKQSHKDKMYAYQIGVEKTDKDAVFDTYKKLMDLGITNMYVLKKSRKDFIIVKYEAKGQDELTGALDAFKTQIASVEGNVGITNLMQICGANDIIKSGKNLTEHKADFEIPCLICD
ncbi:MAG: hypothetical protein ACXVPN_15420 [Bacteroidia bacterium]